MDGWLLYAFHGLNPVATRVLELTGLNTRRLFVLLPREGEPVAVAHRIELAAVEGFPGRVLPYARWEELHAALGQVVAREAAGDGDLARGRRPLPRPGARPAWWSCSAGWARPSSRRGRW